MAPRSNASVCVVEAYLHGAGPANSSFFQTSAAAQKLCQADVLSLLTPRADIFNGPLGRSRWTPTPTAASGSKTFGSAPLALDRKKLEEAAAAAAAVRASKSARTAQLGVPQQRFPPPADSGAALGEADTERSSASACSYSRGPRFPPTAFGGATGSCTGGRRAGSVGRRSREGAASFSARAPSRGGTPATGVDAGRDEHCGRISRSDWAAPDLNLWVANRLVAGGRERVVSHATTPSWRSRSFPAGYLESRQARNEGTAADRNGGVVASACGSHRDVASPLPYESRWAQLYHAQAALPEPSEVRRLEEVDSVVYEANAQLVDAFLSVKRRPPPSVTTATVSSELGGQEASEWSGS